MYSTRALDNCKQISHIILFPRYKNYYNQSLYDLSRVNKG